MSTVFGKIAEAKIIAAFRAPRSSRRRPAGMTGLAGMGKEMMQKMHGDERILDPGGYKDRVRQMWSERASVYDQNNGFIRPSATSWSLLQT